MHFLHESLPLHADHAGEVHVTHGLLAHSLIGLNFPSLFTLFKDFNQDPVSHDFPAQLQ
jgi:hypothetical protein